MTKAYLEATEIPRLEKAAANVRDKLPVRLLSHLDCRASEALSVTVEDIHLGYIVAIHRYYRLASE